MNTFSRIDPDTFFKFAAEHPEQRYELERGVIVQQMTGGTKRHGLVKLQLCILLREQLDQTKFALIQERGVNVGASARYPDIVVEPASEPGDSLATAQPALIVEVLSPSTSATDLNAKVSEYLSLPSLDVYIVASQSEPALLVWQRSVDGNVPATPVEIEGLDKNLDIEGRHFKLRLKLGDIYRGIV